MPLDHNRRIITRYFHEVWNAGDVDLLDTLLTPDYVNHSPGLPDPAPGPAGLKPIVLAMRGAMPDLHYDILDMVVAPDKVAVFLRVTGTHRNGRRFDIRQMQIEWMRDGRICQHWRLTDELGMLRQLELLPQA